MLGGLECLGGASKERPGEPVPAKPARTVHEDLEAEANGSNSDKDGDAERRPALSSMQAQPEEP
jgi:hypothetical protein